ncbi:PDC sensor domain-containing protein, partial [Hyella patelloides]|uniref:PDC sensor domain-containing protein n=1 Tax=Hyella patelloides TaxID=1982969 RepID=UPI0011A700B4
MINNQSPKLNPNQSSNTVDNSVQVAEGSKNNLGKSLTLKAKTTLIAIAIGILPTVFTGFIAYRIADNIIREQVYQNQQNDTKVMLNRLESFLQERYQDIQIIANISIFKDRELRNSTTSQQKNLELTNFAQRNPSYESISFMDLKGNELAVSQGMTPGNDFKEDYFQVVLKTGKPFISQPRFSFTVGEFFIYFAAPVKDSVTNQLVGVVRSRIPVKYLAEVVKNFGFQYNATYHITDLNGIVFITNDQKGQDLPGEEYLPDYIEFRQAGEIATIEFHEELGKRNVVGSYVSNQFEGELAELGWDGFIFYEKQLAYSVQNQFRKVLTLGTITTIVLVAIISIYVASRLVKPILEAASTVEKIGQGDLEQRLNVDSSDEVATLSSNINLMAQQLKNLLQEQKALVQQQQQAKEQLETAIYLLINEISDATEGDLTVRANLNSVELSTVADLFNAIISSLQEIAIEA